MLILKQNQIQLSSEMNMSSPKCSIYSAVPHTLLHPHVLVETTPTQRYQTRKQPPNANTHTTSRETQYHHTTFPHIHTHKLETHKQTCWSVHPLNARTNRQKHIHFSFSHMFKHTVYSVVKGNVSHGGQTPANGSHIHCQGSLHAFSFNKIVKLYSGLQLCCLSLSFTVDRSA